MAPASQRCVNCIDYPKTRGLVKPYTVKWSVCKRHGHGHRESRRPLPGGACRAQSIVGWQTRTHFLRGCSQLCSLSRVSPVIQKDASTRDLPCLTIGILYYKFDSGTEITKRVPGKARMRDRVHPPSRGRTPQGCPSRPPRRAGVIVHGHAMEAGARARDGRGRERGTRARGRDFDSLEGVLAAGEPQPASTGSAAWCSVCGRVGDSSVVGALADWRLGKRLGHRLPV